MGHTNQIFAVVLIAQRHGQRLTKYIRKHHARAEAAAFREANRKKAADKYLDAAR